MIDNVNDCFTKEHTVGFGIRNDLINMATAGINYFIKQYPEKREEVLYDR